MIDLFKTISENCNIEIDILIEFMNSFIEGMKGATEEEKIKHKMEIAEHNQRIYDDMKNNKRIIYNLLRPSGLMELLDEISEKPETQND